nr:unnamed protein product [Spirometra erinaceieuropaei]
MASLFKRSTAGPPPAAIDERADLLERQKAAENEPAWIEAAVLLEETLLVWRLEDGKPVKVKPIDQGVFFDDEVYIVLKSSNKRGKLCFDVHYWVGLKNLEARKYVESLVKNRQGKLQVEFYDEEDLLPVNDFTNQLSDEEVPQRPKKVSFPKSMHRLSDESGQLKLTTVYSGKALRAGINPEDVTFIDTATGLFVYIGPTASPKERASAWSEANKYLKTTNHPHTPLILLRAGETSFELNDVWDDGLD